MMTMTTTTTTTISHPIQKKEWGLKITHHQKIVKIICTLLAYRVKRNRFMIFLIF